MNAIQFIVVARSSNTNSFGLQGHVLVSRSGSAFEVARSPYGGNAEWPKGAVVQVPVVQAPSGAFNFNWAAVSCEIPRALPAPPKPLLASIWEGK